MNKEDYNSQFYRTGHGEECIADFYFFVDSYTKFIKGDKKVFKWIILSLYMFLQNLFVLALKSSNSSYILKKNGQYLKNFDELYKSLKKEKFMLKYNDSKTLSNNPKWDSAIEELKGIRNDFIHLTFDGWSIDYNKVYDIVPECLNIAKFLLEKSNNIICLDNDTEDIDIKDDIIHKIRKLSPF